MNTQPLARQLKRAVTALLFAVCINAHCIVSDVDNRKVDTHITAVTEDWPPLNYLTKEGKIAGYVTEKVAEILEHAELSYDMRLFPWVRAYEMALTQPNVLIFTVYRTVDRDKDFHWICPVAPSIQLHAFALASRTDLNIDTLDDLRGYVIGVSRNDYPFDYLVQNGFQEHKQLDMSANNDVNLQKLLSKRVDFTIGTWKEMQVRLNRFGHEKTKLNRFLQIDVGHDWPLCLALSKSTPANIVKRIQTAHQAILGMSYKQR